MISGELVCGRNSKLYYDIVTRESILDRAPMEFSGDAESRQVVLTLPTPDGQFESFAISLSPVMDPELEDWMAAQGWPMRTYRGVSLDRPATDVRLDWGGPGGFHASVHSPGRSYFIDPYWKGDTETYASYFRSEYVKGDRDFRCLVDSVPQLRRIEKSGASTAGNLRRYRLVVAATGEYTAFHGGTKPLGQAAIVTTVNRVNQIYERDLSIRMVLVGDNSDLVFTDPTGDDNGPGEYVYPTDIVYTAGSFDLTELKVTHKGSKVTFATSVNAKLEDPWRMETGFAVQMLFIDWLFSQQNQARPLFPRTATQQDLIEGSKLFDLAQLAPSSWNLQPWRYLVIESQETKLTIQEACH